MPDDLLPAASHEPALATERVRLFQIVYQPDGVAAPGFEPLDNRANPRPDWYEYWPIRRYLRENPLEEDAFYGFLSPKFGHKTGMTGAEVRSFVAAAAHRADVVLFSPQPDMGALFLNVFEQAETFDSGMIATYEAVLARAGRPSGLRALVMDSRQVCFSNYMVARPVFWRSWLTLNETLFAIAENVDDPLGAELCAPTAYPGGATRKVFLQERTASYLLTVEPGWRSVRCNPFRFAWSATALNQRPLQSVISDALKLAYKEFGDEEYLAAFASIRNELLAGGGTG